MSDEHQRYERARAVFLAAEERGLSREAAIELCGDDESLREEVAALLTPGSGGFEGIIREAIREEREQAETPNIDGFSDLEQIGSGAMGSVFQAVQESPKRSVAIKVLRLDFQNEDTIVRRFESECAILASLNHPNIVQIYVQGMTFIGDRAHPYYVMERVPDALPLTEYARSKNLNLNERIELFIPICDAVHEANARGIVHRDLKPANIIIGSDGRGRVIDFGIARLTELERTRTQETLGTPAYMSPEQLEEPAQVDARSDVYSLGVVLYELICGRLPYDLEGCSIAACARLIVESPPLPAKHSGISADLEAVLFAALRKDRADRYQCAADLREELSAYLEGRPLRVTPPSAWSRVGGWLRRHPVLSTTLLSALAGLLVFLGVAAGIHYASRVPSSIFVDQANRSVHLQSAAGATIHKWQTECTGCIQFAEWIDRPDGAVVAIAFSLGAERSGCAGHLCVYDVSRPETPLWSTANYPHDIPGKTKHAERRFDIGKILVREVFEQDPGDELIVVSLRRNFGASSVRIYSAAGALRYGAWHDGRLLAAAWLPSARRLILVGVNSEKVWDEHGIDVASSTARYPAVIVALEVQPGQVAQRWMAQNGELLDSSVSWYKWLGPAESAVRFGHTVGEIGVVRQPVEHVMVRFFGFSRALEMQARPQIVLSIDAEGSEMGRFVDDNYRVAQRAGKLPGSDMLELCDYERLF